jgi:hypothetical protein
MVLSSAKCLAPPSTRLIDLISRLFGYVSSVASCNHPLRPVLPRAPSVTLKYVHYDTRVNTRFDNMWTCLYDTFILCAAICLVFIRPHGHTKKWHVYLSHWTRCLQFIGSLVEKARPIHVPINISQDDRSEVTRPDWHVNHWPHRLTQLSSEDGTVTMTNRSITRDWAGQVLGLAVAVMDLWRHALSVILAICGTRLPTDFKLSVSCVRDGILTFADEVKLSA